jgi:hypothetical protein
MSKIPASPTKDTIYIDIDDEITSIIDKVSASPHKIVALVLPKRATTLQSVVNMKLLKRASDGADKNVVLVTSEQGLLPLAGAVGLHVATTPQSKPYIPKKPAGATDEDDLDETAEAFNPAENAKKPIGDLAGASAAVVNEDETIQLDNEEAPKAAGAAVKKPKKAKSGKSKDKKLKIPNFDSFRNRLMYGGAALVVLIIMFVVANIVLPKSTITIRTDSEEIDSSFDITFDKDADSIDVDENIAPSVVEQTQKTMTQTAAASGQQNNGQKANGQVTLSLTDCSQSEVIVPSGSTIVANGRSYITQASATMQSVRIGNQCRNSQFTNVSTATVEILAAKAGAEFNTESTSFTYSGSSKVNGSGRANGGTDNITKILNQSDIDGAKQKLATQVDEAVKSELSNKLKDRDLYVVSDSFNTGSPEVTASAKAGDQVDSVTVTQKTTYSLVGVKQSDIEELITESVAGDIDTDKQKVLKTGLDTAVFKLQNQENNSAKVQMSLTVTVLAGPKLDDSEIKTQVAGKKLNETKEIIQAYPGVTNVEVKYSPFWVNANPKQVEKITISYEK